MRTVVFIILLCLAYISVSSQVTNRDLQAEQIKTAVKNLGTKSKTRPKVTLWNLMELEGRVTYISDNSFAIKNTNKKFPEKMFTVKYGDVLELEIKKVFISFFPDEAQRPFGDWEDVRQLKPGDSLQIELEEGKTARGVFYESADTKLTLLSGNKTFEFDREKILRVFRLWEQPPPIAKRIRKGASKGAKAGTIMSRRSSTPGEAIIGGIVTVVGAGIGGGVGAVKRVDQKRLLIFAK